MLQTGRRSLHHLTLALLACCALVGAGAREAGATASVGACCLPGGGCQSVTQFDCEAQSGSFIGVDTSCVMIECASAPLGAPPISAAGAIAAVGALAALGASRLLRRRAT